MSIFPIALRDATVAAIEDISPVMRRVTLRSEQLRGGERDGIPLRPFVSDGFDDHVKLVIPEPDGTAPAPGRQEPGRFDWAPGVLGLCRDYTVRRADPESGTVDLDVVRHDAGRASDWAFAAEVGDPISFAGPKCSAGINQEVDWHLLIGDETALPAIGRWLEEAPAGTRAKVLLEVPDAADRQQLETAAEAEISWLVRPRGVRAGHSTLMLDALRSLEMLPGRVYAWCAGETLTISPIRRYLRRDLALPKEDVEVVGYWRRVTGDEDRAESPRRGGAPDRATSPAPPTSSEPVPTPSADRAPASDPPTPASPQELMHQVHEMSELLAPIVLRVAVSLGIPVALADAARSLPELVETTRVPVERLSPLLDAMIALGLLREDGRGGFVHTALGEVLLEESVQESLDLDTPAGRVDLSLLELLTVVRTGEVATAPALPADLVTWRGHDDEVDAAFHGRREDSLQWNVQPLADLPEVAAAGTVLLCGDGIVPTAAALLARADRRVSLLVAPRRAEMIRQRLDREITDPSRRRRVQLVLEDEELPLTEVSILQHATEALPDARLRSLLDRLSRRTGAQLLLVTDLADDARTDDHVAARTLTALTSTGVALRTSTQLRDLLEGARCSGVRSAPLGWGFGPSVVIADASGANAPTRP
nr:siderophore-interacting protein [Brachybacterium sacelli]